MEISSLSYSCFEGGHSLAIAGVSAFGMAGHLGAIEDLPVRFEHFGAYDPADKRVFNTRDIPKSIGTIKELFAHFGRVTGLQLDYLTVEIDKAGAFRRFMFSSDDDEFTAVFGSLEALEAFLTPFLATEGFEAGAVTGYLEAHPRQRIRVERPAKLVAVEAILV